MLLMCGICWNCGRQNTHRNDTETTPKRHRNDTESTPSVSTLHGRSKQAIIEKLLRILSQQQPTSQRPPVIQYRNIYKLDCNHADWYVWMLIRSTGSNAPPASRFQLEAKCFHRRYDTDVYNRRDHRLVVFLSHLLKTGNLRVRRWRDVGATFARR